MALLHLLQHADPLQHPVGFGDERFADMESREAFAFEQSDAPAAVGNESCHGGSRGTTADDYHVVFRMRHEEIGSLSQVAFAVRSSLFAVRGSHPEAGSWKLETGNWKLETHFYVYRIPVCCGRKKRGRSTSTRSSPARVSAIESRSARARYPVDFSEARPSANRSSTSTPYFVAK